jgi:glycosyltransferase involved in cell wall biosynthesis
MKIAQLVSPWISVPPEGYGGTELIAHYLTEELVKRGHEVTLFASGDSKTNAKLHYVFPEALGNSGEIKQQPLNPLLHYIECFERAKDFDIIHNHAQYTAMFLADLVSTKVIHTIHGSFSKEDVPGEEKRLTLRKFSDHNFVSISNSQRKGLEDINYVATVYNGIDLKEFVFNDKKGEYILWFGRVTKKKGPIDAIEAAKRLEMKLVLCGAIDPVDRPFFETEVKPLIDGEQIIFHEEVKREEKANFYRGALCTLYPIHWEEPFGLVMAESMACGTPVIAYNHGSVSEVVKDGVTGFVVESEGEDKPSEGSLTLTQKGVKGMVEGIKRIGGIDRSVCRRHVEENFTVEKMVDNYEAVYSKVLGG